MKNSDINMQYLQLLSHHVAPLLKCRTYQRLFLWTCTVFGLFLGSLSPSYAQSQVGQRAASFTAPAVLAGEPFEFDLEKALARGPVVVYFFPKAFTSGCSLEAQLFAHHADQFNALQTTVIGVSTDDMETLTRFSEGPCAGKFAVASDSTRQVMHEYGVAQHSASGLAERITFVITPDSKIATVIVNTNPVNHVERALQALEQWQQPPTR